MPRWIILAIILLAVVGRSAVFVLAPASYFDSDQAIFGLMAKHLAELRALPLFMYGQSDMLSILGVIGLAGWLLSVRPPRAILWTWAAAHTAWLMVLAVPHVRLAADYAVHPPVPPKEALTAYASEAVRLSRRPCAGGVPLIPGVYQCP